MEKKSKRFKVLYEQGVMQVYEVIVDTETGVNYLLVNNGSGVGLTPLLERDGRVRVSSPSEYTEEK